MSLIKLRHVDRFVDRHGRWRYYFRRGRSSCIVLLGHPGDPVFMAAYQKAVEGVLPAAQRRVRGDPGTFDRLVQATSRVPNICVSRQLRSGPTDWLSPRQRNDARAHQEDLIPVAWQWPVDRRRADLQTSNRATSPRSAHQHARPRDERVDLIAEQQTRSRFQPKKSGSGAHHSESVSRDKNRVRNDR